MCTLTLFALLRRMAEPTPFLPPFFPPPEISSLWWASIAIIPSGTQEVLPTLVERKYSIGSSLLTNSPSMALAHLLFSGSRSSPDISFAPSSLALTCSWDLGSDQLSILLTVPLSPVFRPNERPPSLNF